MPRPRAPRRGLFRAQFRVAAGFVGMAVMGEVEIAEPPERQQDQEARDASGPFVDRFRSEGRLVRRLMLQREQEDDGDALDGEERPPDRNASGDQRAKCHDQGRYGPARCARPARSDRAVRVALASAGSADRKLRWSISQPIPGISNPGAASSNPSNRNPGLTVQPTSVQSPVVRAACQWPAGTVTCGASPASTSGPSR